MSQRSDELAGGGEVGFFGVQDCVECGVAVFVASGVPDHSHDDFGGVQSSPEVVVLSPFTVEEAAEVVKGGAAQFRCSGAIDGME